MEHIICANASGGGGKRHTSKDLDNLAEMGFTHVSAFEFGLNRETEHWVREVHDRGMKFIARWPDWGKCLNSDKDEGIHEEYCFQNYQRAINSRNNGRVAGPSHWHEKATSLAEESAQAYADLGVDGVILQVIMCDRPFPTDWYTGDPENWRKITSFWSFDKAAKKEWEQVSDGLMMPSRAVNDGRPPDPNMARFYEWYQGAWLRKLDRLSKAALDAGMKDVWSWYVPLDEWTEENMADGTANSMLKIEGWRRKVMAAGGRPVVLTTCIVCILSHWIPDAIKTMSAANTLLEWESICGVRTSHGEDSCMWALEKFGSQQAEVGYSGLYITDTHIRHKEVTKVQALIASLKEQMESNNGRQRAPERSE